MGMNPIRAVVVGTGFGCRIQIPALRAAGFDVVALVGTDRARTAQRAQASRVPAVFTEIKTAVAQTGAELVAISTPPFTHAALALEALAMDCHVLCEKPFARDADQAAEMLAAATQAGKVHALGNEFRFVPQRAMMGRAIAKGRIGEPRVASFVQLSGFVSAFEQDFPDWWFDPAQGGGWLGASGSHAIDQIRCWLGEFASVSASMNTVALSDGRVEDSFAMRFTLANGLEGVLQQSSGALGGMTEITRVAGTKGSIWIDGETIRLADHEGERELPIDADLILADTPPLGDDPRQQRMDWQIMAAVEIAPYTRLCAALRAAILGEPDNSPVAMATFGDGVANMRVLDATRASAQAGGRVISI